MGIQINNIVKNFGEFKALDNVSLNIKSGELVALLGPSGSGKTTLLRIIAGLDFADYGELIIEGEEVSEKHVQQRNVGFMFQHYALFKHMTVFENVAFGLNVQDKKTRPTKQEIRRRVLELLKLVHLEGFHGRYPSQLSGGQRQRVALARALAVQPKYLLLDEPFGALDAKVRKELRRFMRRLHEEINVTTIFVTHDQEEAMEVADKVVVMSNGKIEQSGTPDEVWNKPVNSFVYDFLGNFNEFEGWVDKQGNVHLSEYNVVSKIPNTEQGSHKLSLTQRLMNKFSNENDDFLLTTDEYKPKHGSEKLVKLFARPHEMVVTNELDENEYIRAKVTHINPAGPLVKLELERINGSLLQAEIDVEIFKQLKLEKYDEVFVRPRQLRVF